MHAVLIQLHCCVAQVAKQTRKKQGYMELLDICLKVKQAKDLQKMLKWVTAHAVRHTPMHQLKHSAAGFWTWLGTAPPMHVL